ncbi:MAG: PadR family transcriptional regulator [Actinomycetota bacterium]
MVSTVETHHAQILKGVLDMCVLASIVQEPSYGYALVQKLNDHGVAVPNEGSIYLVLKRLADRGRIEATLVESESGPARKVYSATEAGRDVLLAWEADWQGVQAGVASVLAGGAATEDSA